MGLGKPGRLRVDQPTITGELGPARTIHPLFACDDCSFVERLPDRSAFDEGELFSAPAMARRHPLLTGATLNCLVSLRRGPPSQIASFRRV